MTGKSKECRRCGFLMEWVANRKTPRWHCKPCEQRANRKKKFNRYVSKHGMENALLHVERMELKKSAHPGSKVCPVCWETKDNFEFYQWQSGLSSYCKSCHCQTVEEYRCKTLNHRLRNLFCSTRTGARRRGMEFNLDLSDLESIWRSQDGRCFYSGVGMTIERGRSTVSVDRLDSDGTYTVGNVVLCCSIVNVMKNTMSVSELHERCEQISMYLVRDAEIVAARKK